MSWRSQFVIEMTVGFLVMSCSSPQGSDARRAAERNVTTDTAVPVLVRMLREMTDHNAPAAASVDHAVSARGDIMFFHAPATQGTIATVTDSLGHVVAEFGRFGDGPREYRAPVRSIFSGDSIVTVFDAMRGRITVIDRLGSVRTSIQTSEAGVPISVAGDTIDFGWGAGRHFGIVRWGGEGRRGELVGAHTPEIAAEKSLLELSPRGRPKIPVFGSRSNRVVIGDPWTYTLLVFDAAGRSLGRIHRDLPVRHRSESEMALVVNDALRWRGPRGERVDRGHVESQARKDVMPFFSHVSPFVDLPNR